MVGYGAARVAPSTVMLSSVGSGKHIACT